MHSKDNCSVKAEELVEEAELRCKFGVQFALLRSTLMLPKPVISSSSSRTVKYSWAGVRNCSEPGDSIVNDKN